MVHRKITFFLQISCDKSEFNDISNFYKTLFIKIRKQKILENILVIFNCFLKKVYIFWRKVNVHQKINFALFQVQLKNWITLIPLSRKVYQHVCCAGRTEEHEELG